MVLTLIVQEDLVTVTLVMRVILTPVVLKLKHVLQILAPDIHYLRAQVMVHALLVPLQILIVLQEAKNINSPDAILAMN